jgi:uncharacterized peroxidase-related enzyme
MPHIKLEEGLPGIRGPMAFRPETARPMSELAEILLRGESTLTRAERELIATFVSAGNDCEYCRVSHGAIAANYLGGDESLVACVSENPETAPVSTKLRALLAIAGKVREDVARARAEGATDLEIHDTVLIAAAFCMYNRYVDGLATWTPEDRDSYRDRAASIVRDGYVGLARRLSGDSSR